MKKILALVPVLLVAASCGNLPTNRTEAPNTNKPAESKSPAMVSEAEATAHEKRTWEAVQKKNYEDFGNMLASDYTEVASDGIYDKAGSLSAVKDVNLLDVTFSDWKMLPIDKGAFGVTYTIKMKGTYKGQPFPSSPVRASSA